jgi:hypothetical protein
VLGLAEEEEAEAAARGGREERTLFGAGRCDAGPHVGAVKLQRSQGVSRQTDETIVARKKMFIFYSFYLYRRKEESACIIHSCCGTIANVI